MNKELIHRIQEIIEYSGLNILQFSKEIQVPYRTLFAYLHNKRTVSILVVQKILLRFIEVEERWLILGEGQMLSRKSLAAQKRMQ